MPKVLLTGGTGYIGSHTAVEMLNAGYDVILLDNLSNSSEEVVKKIEAITGKHPFMVRADACSEAVLDRIFSVEEEKNDPIDAVMHFAGFKAVGESVKKPIEYYQNNIGSTLSVLKVMQKHGCNNFIFSSSATVYGGGNPLPNTEDQPIGSCTNPYGSTKYMQELIIRDVAAAYPRLSAVILRYFNPIGCHESHLLEEQPNGIPNNLYPYIVQVAKGERPYLNVFGDDYPTPDGTGVRDYIHVVDLARGHKAALEYAMKRRGVDVFNLGTGKGTSVLELVHAYEKANDVTIPYRIAPRRAGDIAECYADVSKAKELLGWEAEYTVEDACK